MLNQEEYFSDSVRHAEGGTVVPVRSTDKRKARSSPTQRNYFVCNYCYAGARPLNNGAAWDFGKYGYNFSYTFNQDGSKSLNLGVNANIPIETPWVYLEINMGLGLSMNSYSGTTLSTNGGLCVGEVGLCGGIENGGSLYWDRDGSFMGATVYTEMYASFGQGMAKVSTGYEAGLFGMEGRGLYAGANVGKDGASLYASWAENGGWNYGGGYRFEVGRYESDGNYSKLNLFGALFSSESMLLSVDGFYTDDPRVKKWAEYFRDNNPDVFEFMAHADEGGFMLNEEYGGYMTPEEFVFRLDGFGYKHEKIMKLFACEFGKKDAAQYVADLTNTTVIAATGKVKVKINSYLGIKFTQTRVIDGEWKNFYPK